MANQSKLIELRDYVRAHPEEFNMSTWGLRTSCGTSACLAGHASVTLAGDTPSVQYLNGRVLFDYVTPVGRSKDDEPVYVAERAAELLGLDECEADFLFMAENNEDGLARLDFLIEHGQFDDHPSWADWHKGCSDHEGHVPTEY